ncbi:MAG: penicillin-binding protein 2 [Bdellovibrionales bacterium]|nr:penicillin-binding protein 2 [Bdellovibrionales bacterium]
MALHLSSTHRTESNQSRFLTLIIILMFMFLVLLTRLWYLQIFQGRKWRVFSEANQVEIRRIPPIRGKILDRNGLVISESRPSFDIVFKPSKMGPIPEEVADQFIKYMDVSAFDSLSLYDQMQSAGPNDLIVFLKDINRDQLARFKAHQYLFPGIEIKVSPARNYPHGKMGSHFLGYLGEISRKELSKLGENDESNYQMGDVWGISGVEKTYDEVVRGTYGSLPIVVDAFGRETVQEFAKDLLPSFQDQEPIPGNDLVLTIDSKLQHLAEESFVKPSGAIVAMDPRNGEILALVSKPQFEPEKFSRGVSRDYWEELQNDPQNPLYDRSLRGLYPPGSTFKIVTGLAALSEGVIKPEEKVYCPGFYVLGNEVKRCWNRKGHGEVDFHKAIVQSCDVYFYEVGRRLGVDRIAKYSKMFGLSEETGIPINREKSGLIPTEAWKEKRYGIKWVGGETLSVAIGQGFVQVTPIQMAVLVSGVVNGGTINEPRIAMRAQKFDGTLIKTYPTKIKKTVEMDEAIREKLVRALSDVVNLPGGTAYYTGRSNEVLIGGKTGTAQVVNLKSRVQIEDHAWFVAFAPVEKPEIVVSIIVENGGHGGSAAAPIAKKIIEAYLGITHENRT